MENQMTQSLPQRAELGKLLKLQEDVVRRTVLMPEDYLDNGFSKNMVLATFWRKYEGLKFLF